jgi:Leucine-rich repeat (LRR) protein
VEFPGDWIRTYEKQPCEVHTLSLVENNLTMLNGVTFSAPKLEVLLLSDNRKLEAMPKQFLKGIENLKVLDLSNCFNLKSVPKEIGNLRQLTHLDLHNCGKLRYLPEVLGKLTQLIHLDLSWCLNLKLPKSIGCLQHLQWLDLTKCDCHCLPSTMGDLKSLQYLSVASRSIYGQWGEPSWKSGQAFAVDISKLTTLTNLHISGDVCQTVEQCDQLLRLVSKLVKLKSLHICDFFSLKTLPDAFQSMVHLEEFWVWDCQLFRILPSFITLFSKLKVLRLDRMSSLENLPALNTLKMLSTLSIKECKLIKKLPDSFTSSDAFPSLKELDCLGSGLVEFSEVEDGAMPKLQILNFDCTDIKSLPDTLIYLKNLKVVYICQDGFGDLCEKFKNSWLSGKFEIFFPMSKDQIGTYERQPCEVHKLSLMENDLTTLNGVTFSAPKLDCLLLAQDEKLEALPKQFLKGIENLKVLEPGTSQGKSR